MNRIDSFALRNVTAAQIAALDVFKAYHLPAPDSPLIRTKPRYYQDVLGKRVIQIEREKIPENLDYKADIGQNAQIVFAEVLIYYMEHSGDVNSIEELWGFDADALPDIPFLLKVIAFLDKNSVFIKGLPVISPVLNAEEQELQRQTQMLALGNLAVSGVTHRAPRHVIKNLEERVGRCKSIYLAYFFGKFKLATLEKDTKAILNSAEGDASICKILQQTNAFSRLKVENLSLPAAHVELANKITNDRMEIETPTRESHAAPPKFVPATINLEAATHPRTLRNLTDTNNAAQMFARSLRNATPPPNPVQPYRPGQLNINLPTAPAPE